MASSNSPDVDINSKQGDIRAGARDLFMSSPVAVATLRRLKTNVVGYGLKFQSRINRETLGISDEEAETWEHNTESEFNLWAESEYCDLTHILNFYEIQALVVLSVALSGDCFIVMCDDEDSDIPYNLRLKIIEADYCCNPNLVPDTETLAGGVEIDPNTGRVIAYHFANKHPGGLIRPTKWERICIYSDTDGCRRRNVLHRFETERPGQRRGVALLATVTKELKQLTRLSDSELTAAVVSSFFTVAITSPQLTDNLLDGGITESDKITNPTTNASDQSVCELGPGNMIGLNPGEQVQSIAPNRPNQAFEPFFNAITRQIGAATGVPSELIMLLFTSSYSASRGALLEAWKFFNTERSHLKNKICRPILQEFLTEGILIGRIKAPGFFKDPLIKKSWCGSEWNGPGQGQLDPTKETDAAVIRINNSLSTRAKEVAAISGDDFGQTASALGREKKMLEKNGIGNVFQQPVNTAADSGKQIDPNDDTNNGDKTNAD
jgi:lambda family phage portal protein